MNTTLTNKLSSFSTAIYNVEPEQNSLQDWEKQIWDIQNLELTAQKHMWKFFNIKTNKPNKIEENDSSDGAKWVKHTFEKFDFNQLEWYEKACSYLILKALENKKLINKKFIDKLFQRQIQKQDFVNLDLFFEKTNWITWKDKFNDKMIIELLKWVDEDTIEKIIDKINEKDLQQESHNTNSKVLKRLCQKKKISEKCYEKYSKAQLKSHKNELTKINITVKRLVDKLNVKLNAYKNIDLDWLYTFNDSENGYQVL